MNVVLIEPQIPGNTGNIGRTCVGTQSTLHLVGRCGFSLRDKELKRAGLDYWKDLKLKLYEDWGAFWAERSNAKDGFFFFEKDAFRDFWEAQFVEESYLVFGSETKGFPEEILRAHKKLFYKIPMSGAIRSLNLSSAAAIVLYEAIRQTRNPKIWR